MNPLFHDHDKGTPLLTRSFAVRTLVLFAGFFLASCFGDRATGPAAFRYGRFSVVPSFDWQGVRLVDFQTVRILLLRADSSTALDTTVNFPSNADEITLNLPVLITGAQEALTLSMAMINAAGDTVFRAGPIEVTATSGSLPPVPVTPGVRYVGLGSNAAGVRLVSPPSAMFFQDTVMLVAEAFDSSGVTIPSTPIVYETPDTNRITVPDAGTPRFIARTTRGPAILRARLLTHDTVETTVAVQPRPNAITVVSGNEQSGTVGRALTAPVVVQVNAVDNLGVRGIWVRFAVTAGGGSITPDSALTDSTGRTQATWTLGTSPGPQSMSATVPGLSGASATVGLSATASPGSAALLNFIQQPTDVDASQPITPAVQVEVTDSFSNRVTSLPVGATVTLAIANNPAAGTLAGTVTRPFISGVAIFPGLSINNAGAGYTLRASSGTLPTKDSDPFEVRASVPARLSFQVEPPATVTAGVAITPDLVVRILDAADNVVVTSSDTVTLVIGSNPGGATLSGTAAVAAVNGVATFSGLSLDQAATGYTLIAQRAGVTPDTTAPFAVQAGPATVLEFTSEPSASETAGQAFAAAVRARDAYGNTATSFGGAITLNLAVNPGSDALGGTVTLSAAGGVATFSGLSLTRAAAGYRLGATSGALTPDTTSAFTVVAAAPAQLVFTTLPPATQTAGAPFTVAVAARDAFDNPTASFAGNVSLALASGPGTLGGTLTVAASGGVATFSTPFINQAGSGYTIRATAGALTPDTTGAFAITPAAASVLVFTAQPASAEAGIAFAPAIQVVAQDAFGNTDTTFTGAVGLTLGANPAGDSLVGTDTMTAVAGVATFSGLRLRRAAAGVRIDAGSGALAGSGAPFTVAPGPAFVLEFTTQPAASSQAGAAITATVTARDSLGNVATGFTGSVALALAPNSYGATLGGTASLAAAAGVATFTNLYLDKTGTGYLLGASTGGVEPDTSTSFDITPALASSLDITQQPPDTVVAGVAFTVTVTARDSFGNVADAFAGTVSLGFATNPSAGTLGGTVSGTPTAGVITFATPFIDKSGAGYALTATAPGVAPDTTTPLAIVPSTPVRVVYFLEPTGQEAGLPFSGGVQVAAQDSFGNTATQYADTIALDIVVNPGTDTLSGITRIVASSGLASFPTARLRTVGNGYRVRATGRGLLGTDTSAAFNIIPGGAVELVFTTEPPDSQQAGTAFTLVVTARDSLGNTATAYVNPVTIGLQANPGPGTLGGPLTQGAAAGVATFTSPYINKAAAGYTILATGPGVDGDTSSALTIYPGPATIITALGGNFQVQDTASLLADSLIVQVEDGFGNTTPGDTIVWTVTSGGGASSLVTTVADSAGRAAIRWTLGARVGLQTLQAGGPGLTPLTFEALGTPNAMTRRWIGTTGDWNSAANWLPAGMPGATDQVFVPAVHATFAPNGPALTANAATKVLRGEMGSLIQAGAFTLFVDSAFDVGTVTNAPGGALAVRALNNGTARGIVGDLNMDPTYAFSFTTVTGRLVVNGRLNIPNNTGFTVGASDTLVASDVVMALGGFTVNGIAAIADTLYAPGGAVTVAGAMTVGTFVQSGSNVSGAGSLDIATRWEWSGGDISGTGIVRAAAGSTVLVSGSSSRNVNGATAPRVIEIGGTATWAGTAWLRGGWATLRILPTGSLDVQGSSVFFGNAYSPAIFVLDNQGTLRRSVTGNTFSISATAFTSSGTIAVDSGRVELNGGSTVSGPLTIGAGDSLQISGGTHSFDGSSAVSGAGLVRVTSGTLTLAGSYAITGPTELAGGSVVFNTPATASTGALSVSNGTLSGTGTLEVSGAFDWSFGTLSGTGTTRVLAGGGGVWFSSTKTLNGRTIELAGGVNWTAGNINASNGAVVRTLAGGSLDAQANASLANVGGVQPVLDNQGTVSRTTGTGTATIDAALTGGGAVTVAAAALSFTGGGTNNVTFTTTSPGVLRFGGGTHTISGGFSGTGTVDFSGGTTTLTGGYAVGQTSVSGGTAVFDNVATATTGALAVSNGTLSGTGTLEVSGAFDWSFGTLSGTGTTRVLAGGGGVWFSSTKTLNGRTIELAGGVNWTAGNINASNGAVVRTLAGGSLDAQANASLANVGGVQPVLDNQGTVSRTTGTGTATIDAALTNSGSVTVAATTLSFNGGGTSGGAFTTASPGVLRFGGGTHTISGGFSGTGEVDFSGGTATLTGAYAVGATRVSGGTAVFDAVATAATGALYVTNGTLSGMGTLEVSGPFDWTFGTLSGSGITRVLSSGSMTLSSSTKTLSGGRTLENYSAAAAHSAGTLQFSGGTLLNAAGAVFDITGNVSLSNVSGTNRVTNAGTLRRSTTIGTASVNIPVTNSVGGTIDVVSGTLSFNAGGAFSGATHTVAAGATLDFGGATDTLNTGFAVSGAGTVLQSGGTVSVDSAAIVTFVNFTQGNGVLSNAGTVNVTGTLDWQFGTITGPGTTRAQGAGSVLVLGNSTKTLSGGQTLENQSATATYSAGTLQFTGGTLLNTAGAVFDVTGNVTLNNLSGTNRLTNLGTLRRSAGSGVATISVPVTSTAGTIDVQVQTLRLNGGGRFGGAHTVSSGATLEFGAGADTLNAGFAVAGAGTTLQSGGTLLVDTSATPLTTVTFENFTLANGTLDNRDTVSVTGTLNWQFGTITGAGLTYTQGATSSAVLNNSTKNLTGGHTFAVGDGETGGTGSWSAGSLQLDSGATQSTFRVSAGATFDITGNVSATNSGGTNLLDIQGTLRRTTATGVATLAVPVQAYGPVQVQTGTLRGSAGGYWGTAVTVDAGATLEFSGGAHSWVPYSPGFSSSGLGTVLISGGTVDASSDLGTYGVSNLTVTNGTFTNAGYLEISGAFNWQFGTIDGFGNLTVLPGGTMLLSNSTKTLQSQTIDNQGSATWTAGTIQMTGGSLINSAGATFAITGNVLLDSISGSPSFTNNGSLLRSTGTGTATIDVYYVHQGDANVSSGTLNLTRGGSLDGTATVAAGAFLNLAGGTFTASGNGFDVTGDLGVTAGTFDLGGVASSVSGNFATSFSGTLTMQSAADTLDVAGNASFNGNPTTSLLINGVLLIGGNFSQGGSTSAFAASGSHVSQFVGSATQTVSFSNPGIATSRFGLLRLAKSGGAVNLFSNTFADSVADTTAAVADSIFSAGRTLTVQGFYLLNTLLDSTALVVSVGNGSAVGSSVQFRDMDPTIEQFVITRPNNTFLTFGSWSFLTTPTTGRFVAATRSDTGDAFIVTFTGATPSAATANTRCRASGGASITWNGTPLTGCVP